MVVFNKIIGAMPKVLIQARRLNCTVVAVLGAIILCQRDDLTFITWRVGVYDEGVEFISGCYDMSKQAGRDNLIERSLT